MSGIAGMVFVDGRSVTPADLLRMAQAHPHPTSGQITKWAEGPAGLLRFPLNLTPESVGESQPFLHPGSGAALLFDGRLDNRSDLLDRLAGELATSAPDGRIVLHVFERFGTDVVRDLVGDYALALWRPDRRTLYCARSPVGFRPFLWTLDAGRFAFATEPRTLIRGLGLEPKLNEGLVGEFLSGRFTDLTDTFWQGVYRLEPGGELLLEDGHVSLRRWNEGPFEDLTRASPEAHIERFTSALDQALIAANRSAGPVASQLSGGLDSSTVVCRSEQLFQRGALKNRVQPISARFPGQTNDEGFWINAVERQTGLTSQTVYPTTFNLETAGDWCAHTLYLPMRPNALATLASVCDAVVASGGGVLLTGEGGDDWFNGSRSHWPDLAVQGRWGSLLNDAMDQGGGTIPGKLYAMSRASLGPLVSKRQRDRVLFGFVDYGLDVPDWLSADWAARIDLRDRWANIVRPPAGLSLAQQERYAIYATGKRHLTYDVSLSYAASRGIELRNPLHDLRLSRFAMSAAGPMLKRGPTRKRVLRDAMRGVLPEEVRTRTSKANFSASLVNAVSERFRQKPPEEMLPARLGWVNMPRIVELHEEYRQWSAQGALPPFPKIAYGPIWNVVALDIWLEHAFKL